jgi:hypothetical protein
MLSFSGARARLLRSALPAGHASRLAAFRAALYPRALRLRPLRTLPARHPVVFGSVICAAKTGAADYVVQRYIEDVAHEDVRWARTGAFTLFGFGYLGIVQHFWYVVLMTRVLWPRHARVFLRMPLRGRLADAQGWRDTLGQTALDMAVICPLFYYPTFYLIQAGVESLEAAEHREDVVQQGEARRDSSDDMATRNGNRIGARGRSDHAEWEWVRHGMSTWRNNVGADVVEYGKVWGPALIFNFSVCPAHLRVPFIAGVSFFWTMVLSIMRGKTAP